MTQPNIKILKSALKVLQKEFGKTKCKEPCASCVQCWADISIIQLKAIISICDDSGWEKIK